MILQELAKRSLIQPPHFLVDNTHYLTMMGSIAYGVSGDTSDMDVYGFCIPPKEDVFPHLRGEIFGFGQQKQRFDVWQQHHIKRQDKDQTYDFAVYSIVRFFHLCMENNPNMLDSLFTPRRCVLHSTQVGELVRESRKSFIHKGSFHKFRGYAFAQLSKIRNKTNSSNPKRAADVEKHGMDTKFAYHVVRLALECEQLLLTGDLDLERDREMLKAIRRGEWSFDQLEAWFNEKERYLETVYAESKLPHSPDEGAIKALLLRCLEHHYGSLSTVIQKENDVTGLVRKLEAVLADYR